MSAARMMSGRWESYERKLFVWWWKSIKKYAEDYKYTIVFGIIILKVYISSISKDINCKLIAIFAYAVIKYKIFCKSQI